MIIRFIVLIFLLTVLTSFQSCRKVIVDEGVNTFKVGLAGHIPTIDPALSFDLISAMVVYQIYEPLYEYDYLKRPYIIKPLLAEDMPLIENNGKKYTIKIKKNIMYHNTDGIPAFRMVKAIDFINQIKRLAYKPTNSTGKWLFEGKIKGFNEFSDKVGTDFTKFFNLPIEGLTALDDHTLVIELNMPYPQMLNALCMSFSIPVPEEAIKFYKNDFSFAEVGTGPFYIKEKIDLRSGIKLKKFPQYSVALYPSQGDRIANDLNLLTDANKQIPFINEIHYSVMEEENTRWLNFKKGNIDYIQLTKDSFKAALNDAGELDPELKEKNIQVQVVPTLTFWWVAFNMRDPILGKNKYLRQAIAHAINWDEYIDIFTNKVGQKANSIYPPGIPGYNPSKKLPYEFNLEKAKELMKKSGFPDGKGLPVFSFDLRGISTEHRQKGEFIQKELAKIGIKINVIPNMFPAFLEKSRGGKLQFWQSGWVMDYPDAENVLQLLVSKNFSPGPNSTFYNNKKFDDLFERIKTLPDGAEKFDLMDQMEMIVNDDLPWIMQFYSRNYYLYQSRVKNFRNSDIILNFFKYLRISDK